MQLSPTPTSPTRLASGGSSRPAHAVPKRARRGAVVTRAKTPSSQQSVLEKAVNGLQVLITNSPVNEGKKRFFKMLAGQYDEEATRAKIQGLIDKHPVMVFSWSVCPFAQRSQRILREAGARFHAIELDRVADGKAIKAELGMLTGRTSVPSIWVGGQCIGGCNDGSPGLVPLLERGELQARLKAVGAL